MCEGKKVVHYLEKLMEAWDCICLDASSRSVGLVAGWKSKGFHCTNSMAFFSGLGTVFFFLGDRDGFDIPKHLWALP
jgi:hypothetical protein